MRSWNGVQLAPGVTVAAAVVVVARDELVRVGRVDLDRGLVLRLGAALQVRIAQIQAVLVDLDDRAVVVDTVTASLREVVVVALRTSRVVVPALRELERREA